MSNYAYVAVDPKGGETRGTLDVADQAEALRRIKDMGLFPTRLLESRERKAPRPEAAKRVVVNGGLRWWKWGGKVKPASLAVFTRQLATLIEDGAATVVR